MVVLMPRTLGSVRFLIASVGTRFPLRLLVVRKGLDKKLENWGEEVVDLEDEPFVPGPDQVRKDFDRNGNQLGPSSGAFQQISAH
ncbi:hypothetical protein SCAR479_10584 [Seiridium cardinale]|uniref:Uncharacterized protein n=1 Tax=Seiridium cardinale TaxID=138064 RepID=A0ABR2XFY5_9PEZI